MPLRKPPEPAAQFRVGTKKTGNDGNIYVVKKSADQKTWVKNGEIPKSAPNLIVSDGKVMQFSVPNISRRMYLGWVDCPSGLSAGEIRRSRVKDMKPAKYHMHWIDGCLIAAKRVLCDSDIMKIVWKHIGSVHSERGIIGFWHSGYKSDRGAILNDPRMEKGSMVISGGKTVAALTEQLGSGNTDAFAVGLPEPAEPDISLFISMKKRLRR